MTAYEKWLGKADVAILQMIGLLDRPAEEDEISVLRAEPVIAGLTDALVGFGDAEWNKAVVKLRRAGLLSAQRDKSLDAHPLVRQHFGEQLKAKQPKAWREGHRRLYVHLKEKAKPLPETIEEMAPLYAAVVHGCLAGKNKESFDEVFWSRIRRKEDAFNMHRLGAFVADLAALSAFFDPPWERLAPGLDKPEDQARVLNETGLALRARGRLQDATPLLQRALKEHLREGAWQGAAKVAGHLSEVFQTLGDLKGALTLARESVGYADRTDDDLLWRCARRATLADVLHQLGRAQEAELCLEDATGLRAKREKYDTPILFATQGFSYCNLLLDRGQEAEVCLRAEETLAENDRKCWLFEIALDHLSLGRAHLLSVQHGTGGEIDQVVSHLKQAVDGLGSAGRQDQFPLGLLARAALHTHTRAFNLARKDLTEALTLATRCGLRLHEADAHLGHARLSLAEGNPPAALDHLAAARTIIDATGYHRRDGELAQLEAEARAMPDLPLTTAT
jgi:tetratricopeptide (TPR) repeat protein